MKKLGWKLRIGLIFVAVSVVLYIVHYLIFQNFYFLSEYTLFYFAWLPIEVLVVTLVLDQLLEMRDLQERMEKLNMVIGVFFSESGTFLLHELSGSDPDIENIRQDLVVGQKWTDRQFDEASQRIKQHPHHVDINQIDLEKLKNFLVSKREFSVRLLENPVILEHESFTELLMAVFHLTEELEFRKNLKSLPDSDLNHIKGDIERVYARLIGTWLDYMKYMKKWYPYLYSLSMRTNPFDFNSSPIVTP
ncbi:MAG TPA: hypothetical protein VMC84_02755 [Methanocella sp.]|uniref:hypothetical protein n=1 Tax=Methanocella sp. TaxID=2052833 RepID=UPI002CDF44FF|nr:hypothetical protein [Methanocella sp.]HTY90073.1 hypothetical protein [Methanocella sp.]